MFKILRTDEPIIARAISFGWFKRVYIGSRFDILPPDEQLAALTHEEGHCDFHHTEIRILFLLLMPPLLSWLCRRQEFQADRYSSQRGHSSAMLQILKDDSPGNWLSPSHADRRERIIKYQEQLRSAPVTGNFALTA